MVFRQPGLVAADKVLQLSVAPNLAHEGVIDHHLPRPHRLETVTVALLDGLEVLRDRVVTSGVLCVTACQLDSTDEIRKPGHRDLQGGRRS
jgi:hypothetical protein